MLMALGRAARGDGATGRAVLAAQMAELTGPVKGPPHQATMRLQVQAGMAVRTIHVNMLAGRG